MKVTTETIATREVQLTIEPDEDTVRQGLRRTARQVSRQRPVSGYRPGHAPYALVENIYGREALLYETLNDLGPELYREAIEQAEIDPLQQGQLDIESEDPLVLTAKVPLVPVVELGDYEELSIEPAPEVSVSEEQIQERLEQIQRENVEYQSVDRGIELGDQVVASIVGTSDGEAVVNQTDSTLDIDDELSPAGFAEALLGAEAGEAREFSLTFPEDHDNEELAGRQVDFEVAINSVREVILPPIDDELAKMAGDYDSLEEMREAVAEELQEELEQQADQNELDSALDALIEISKIEYPEALIERELEGALDEQRGRLQQMGFTLESYLRMTGQTEEDLKQDLRPDVERRTVRQLVLAEFGKSEDIEFDEEERSAQMKALTDDLQETYGDQADEILQDFTQSGGLFSMYQNAYLNKIANHLRDMLTGRLKEKEEAELQGSVESESENDGEEVSEADTAEDTTAPKDDEAPSAETTEE